MFGPISTVVSFVLLIWAIFFVAIQSGRMKRKKDVMEARFWEEETIANAVKKKDIDEALFFTDDLSRLPTRAAGDPHQVERAAQRRMIRFTEPMTNLALKMQYGSAQLELICNYEENYSDYIRRLTRWAEALAAEEKTEDALRVLEHAASLGSEYRKTYKLAADLYVKARNQTKLQALLATVEANNFRDPAVQQHVVAYITQHLTLICV